MLAPPHFNFYALGPYNPSVPKPESILGYGPGEHETTFSEQDRVVRAISDGAKAKVVYIPYGKTAEGRRLRVLAISSPENIRKLEAIRADIGKLADGTGNAAEITKNCPVIVWVNECIHGNEPASFEDAMWLAYNLAASENPAVEKALKNAVVILNPCYNPDGHERFVVWYNSVAVGSSDPGSLEHREPAETYGRLNHYRFDMNRDRIAMSQDETKEEVAEYLRWNPQVYADQHGQVSTYFFPPASLSVNVNVDRDRYHKWAEVFGHATGQAFDNQGFAYYVKDVFDLYYPGYLDSWTTLSGAIGMTHETDGSYAINELRDDGSIATLRGSMARHFTSAVAVIESAADHREELLQSFAAYRAQAANGSFSPDTKYVVLHSSSTLDVRATRAQLTAEGIESELITIPCVVEGLSFWSKADGSTTCKDGETLVVPMAQPQGHLVKALFETDSNFEPEFIKEQIRRRAQADSEQTYPNAEPAEFYDVTGWNPAFAGNFDAWFTKVKPVPAPNPAVNKTMPAASLGFIARPSEESALVIADLLAKGVRAEYTTKTIVQTGSPSYPPGSVMLYRDRNQDDLETTIHQVENKRGTQVFEPLSTSYPVEGREGAGSESVRPMHPLKIGIVFGDSGAPSNFGAIWFAMERVFKLPFTPLTSVTGDEDLSSYSCLIFPRGRGGAGSQKLKDWINNGGCAIVLGAQGWSVGESGLVKLDTVKNEKGQAPDNLPGSLFRAQIDPQSFLGYGYLPHPGNDKVEIAIPIEGSQFYKAKAEGGSAVTLPKDEKLKLLSGWEWPNDTEKSLQGTVWVQDQPVGGGHVIIFMSDPTERAMWPGLHHLLLNAILFGPNR
jgi:hypothetical protein